MVIKIPNKVLVFNQALYQPQFFYFLLVSDDIALIGSKYFFISFFDSYFMTCLQILYKIMQLNIKGKQNKKWPSIY